MRKFYAFSGLDGSGKSTQIDLLKKHFNSNHKEVKVIWSRGGYTPFFQGLKEIVRKVNSKSIPKPGKSDKRTRSFDNKLIRKIWLSIAIIDMLFLYGIYFRWCRFRGKVIIADRYAEDTMIDFRLNFSKESIEKWLLWRMMYSLIPSPQKHFILLIPIQESMRRSILKNEPFPDDELTLTSRLDMYNKFLKQNDRFVYIDCMNSIEIVNDNILEMIRS